MFLDARELARKELKLRFMKLRDPKMSLRMLWLFETTKQKIRVCYHKTVL